jgi:hypothetical protein
MLFLVLMLVLDPSPREAEPFTRINAALSRRPLLAPCSQRRASDTIASVRALYRKERTDHGRQPAPVASAACHFRRGPFPSSVIPSRGDDEGPPQGSDHPSSVYVLPSRLTRRVVHSPITDHSLPFASCSLLLALPLQGRQLEKQADYTDFICL